MVTKVVAMFEVVSRKVKQLENNRMTMCITGNDAALAFIALGNPTGNPDQDARTAEIGDWLERVLGEAGATKPLPISSSSLRASLAEARELALIVTDATRVVIALGDILPAAPEELEAIWQEIVAMPAKVFFVAFDTTLQQRVDRAHRDRVSKWAKAVQREFPDRIMFLSEGNLAHIEVFDPATTDSTAGVLRDWLKAECAAAV